MKFLSALKAERLISQIADEQDASSAAARKSFEKLKQMGAGAVPKVLATLGSVDKQKAVEYVEVLSGVLSDKTLMEVAQGLADVDPRTVKRTAWALTSSKRYNPNRLIDLLPEEGYSKSAILEVLTGHKDRLNIRQLLGQVYFLAPSEKAAVFKLVEDCVDSSMVPDLIARMDGKDPMVKMHLINVLSQFDQEDVSRAIQEQLQDNNKLVRMAALTGLAKMHQQLNLETVAGLLLDPDVDVMNKAVEVIISINDPKTVKYLLPALKDENEFSRRAAVEILNEVGNANSVKYLLQAVSDEDWWVRARASDALARIGGPRVVDAVLELVRDKDEDIRRAAIEILNTTRDPRAVDHLIECTRDEDWWVSERAADALADMGNEKAVPALLAMLDGNEKSLPVVLNALGKLGNHKILDKILPFMQRPEKQVQISAFAAAARLADESRADAVRAYIQQCANVQDETVNREAVKALTELDKRFNTGASQPTPTIATERSASRAFPPPPPPPVPTASQVAKTLLLEQTKIEDVIEEAKSEAQRLDINALNPGDLIEGRYKFIEKIGKGAFGTVLLVEDTVVDDRLILKFLNPNVASDEEMMQRFVHELRYSRKITHENVIRIYDFLYMGGGYAISMEYFPSHTLGGEIIDQKPMLMRKAIKYACDICTGMIVAHAQGIVHRDLKPANILINDDGLLKIVDFGVAAAQAGGDTQLTKTGYVIGSPKYMAPEQILGKKVDERADIYSVGVILYEMLTGVPPYSRGDHMSVMYQHVQGKARSVADINPKVPKTLSDIVGKAMMVDKDKRFQSMDEFRGILASLLEQAESA
jgi:serine/threonine-protein kinase